MSNKLCFCWGFFGATLPEIIRIQKILTNPIQKIDFLSTPYYLLFLLAYLCAAGLLSIAWKPENPYKAIWLGVSFPVIISTMAVQVPY